MNASSGIPGDLIEQLGRAAGRLFGDMLGHLANLPAIDHAEIARGIAAGIAADPARWRALQEEHYREQLALWQQLATPDAAPEVPQDRRFRAPEWREQPWFAHLARAYDLNARWLGRVVEALEVEPRLKRRLRFFTRQYADALAPANFPHTNPEVLRLAAETRGESLSRGLRNLVADLDRGRISMTDESAFTVGGNLAVTPGAVVFENEYFQLLQYAPVTDTVRATPLLIVPPFINKYYILDLQPANSFVRYAVEQGYTVFLVSWRNAGPELAHATWDDYLEHAVLRALDVTLEIAGTRTAHTLGFCVGGTLLAAALAVQRARRRNRAASLTLLTTMLDFGDTGDLGVFVDEAYVAAREQAFAQGGLFHGRDLMATFSSLRPNDLIWPYVVNNYLKGRSPEPFDLLYWNSDSTNLPGPMYAYYVRQTYLENNLRVPGRLAMCGTPVDLGRIRLPCYVLATREDHIVPWQTAYASARLLKGSAIEFVLAASGHIAGVVNPAAANRRNYWTGGKAAKHPDKWLATAQSVPGSWWPHWAAWLAARDPEQVPARIQLGSPRYPVLEPAPGRYVKVRCEDISA